MHKKRIFVIAGWARMAKPQSVIGPKWEND